LRPFSREAAILAAVGHLLPHARLDTGSATTRPRKQAARMLKCECSTCGYTVRTARKWLETVGAPLCPIEGAWPDAPRSDRRRNWGRTWL